MAATIFAGGDPSKVDVSGYSKGDLLAADATGTLQPVAIGSNAEALTVDTTQPEDIDWVPGGGAPVTSVFGRNGAVVATNGDYTVSQVTGAAPSAGPTFTGTVTASGRVVVTPDTLTDAATVLVDASLGNHFRLTLTGTGHTLGNPSNLVDGQKLLFELIQSAGGGNTLLLGNKYVFGTGITSFTMTSTANKRDFLGVVYNSTTDLLYVIALAQGY